MKTYKPSRFFKHIETEQAAQPWGALLDAGAGSNSLAWVSQLETDRWTAVTGAPQDAEKLTQQTASIRRAQDRIVLGNWAKVELLKGEVFDTVIADYLLGAVEGFAPYFQSYLFARLRPLTRHVLYITGVEPYVPSNEPPTRSGRLVWEIGRYRDACLLLSGELPYREYPSAWVIDQLKRSGFEPRSIKSFKTTYKSRFVETQIGLSKAALSRVKDPDLAGAMHARGEALRAEAAEVIASEGGLQHGSEYVIAAVPV